MNNARRRPAAHNPVIWRKVSKDEIAAAERAAAERVHEHAFYNHVASRTHMACACGHLCRRDMAPADLVFQGPAVRRG